MARPPDPQELKKLVDRSSPPLKPPVGGGIKPPPAIPPPKRYIQPHFSAPRPRYVTRGKGPTGRVKATNERFRRRLLSDAPKQNRGSA